ncbi:tRNA (adenosine(37)-N6)-threonylcarbamoyltransferase complex dimerization subunit type 1 TsaB [Pleomorphomonas sp. JP5]|uniref:tRNA (adenosine(37)-N6)-threonylcarbamoyltransferase complex dimerization subunit type 1 TsaB n=1 Tax=Pleomorphomonas sp. JP5 TaxID=2942998 RepID=UPI0020443AD2|nr:tRNA (adenosine(37)-N6)-threonylcarbamoyltransferase complex dimerization subunit type 1 TsaB [Pleomorphomonas sp. JP5]MCM5557980.1 tRNA (adenosine(37)-N6)-threonylcarbamoyltransferase complex dimerization subunit type 1 TsaB [Pleomorphomonas sp. JP5]
MLTLALDTANDRVAVALSGDGKETVRAEAISRGHAERLFPLIDEVLTAAGVDIECVGRIAVNVGPGSFTGIRIAVAAGRGLGLALGVPVVGIDALRLIAASLEELADGPILAAVDARRGEIYAALYGPKGEVLEPPFAADAESVLDRLGASATVIAGSGAAILTHQAAISGLRVPPVDAMTATSPLALARLGSVADPDIALPRPLYLRAPDAKPQPPVPGLLAPNPTP